MLNTTQKVELALQHVWASANKDRINDPVTQLLGMRMMYLYLNGLDDNYYLIDSAFEQALARRIFGEKDDPFVI